MQRKRAFTLIELLVVIAIIAILAAILFPVFAKARERAKQSASLNNLKQLAIGVMSYSQDYGETFPGWRQRNAAANSGFSHNVWDEQINPSIKSKDVYNNKDTGFKSPSDPAMQRVVTYGLNGFLIATPTSFNGSVRQQMIANEAAGNPPAPLSTSTVSDPADTILFAELATEAAVANFTTAQWAERPAGSATTGSEQWQAAMVHWIDISPREWVETPLIAGAPAGSTPYDDKGWDPTRGVARDFYGGGGNYAFVDGHVKFQKLGQTVGLGKTFTLPNGSASPVIAPGNNGAWNASNSYNQWNPSR